MIIRMVLCGVLFVVSACDLSPEALPPYDRVPGEYTLEPNATYIQQGAYNHMAKCIYWLASLEDNLKTLDLSVTSEEKTATIEGMSVVSEKDNYFLVLRETGPYFFQADLHIREDWDLSDSNTEISQFARRPQIVLTMICGYVVLEDPGAWESFDLDAEVARLRERKEEEDRETED